MLQRSLLYCKLSEHYYFSASCCNLSKMKVSGKVSQELQDNTASYKSDTVDKNIKYNLKGSMFTLLIAGRF